MAGDHNLKRINGKMSDRLNSIRHRCESVISGTGKPEYARLFADVEYLLLVIGGEFEPSGARQEVIDPPNGYT